jgi:hypothetical protein
MDKTPISIIAAMILITLALVSFATLTATVTDQALTIRLGIGLIRKRFPLAEIVSCRVVQNPWYYGWGIRYTPRGWLFSVSGLQAIELGMKNGKHYRIGTNQPDALAHAIEAALENLVKGK